MRPSSPAISSSASWSPSSPVSATGSPRRYATSVTSTSAISPLPRRSNARFYRSLHSSQASNWPPSCKPRDSSDFFQIPDDIVDVVIADVSGKGAAASLLMPSLAVALRLRARELSGPAAILKDLDGVLKQITNSATFVTMFYARFNPTLRTLEYASGGHNPPLLLRTSTGESLLLEEAGPIMGILPDAQFSNTNLTLEPGDILTLYTDGVTEQEDESGEEFSLDRLKKIVLSKESDPASAMVTDIAEAVSTFAGTKEQSDDLTVVVAKVL